MPAWYMSDIEGPQLRPGCVLTGSRDRINSYTAENNIGCGYIYFWERFACLYIPPGTQAVCSSHLIMMNHLC